MQEDISILIVEDEEIWIQQLQFFLKDFGFTSTKAVTNLEDALVTLSSTEYDLMLLDINLGGKNSGIELGKIITRLYNKPFIFITSSNTHQLKEAAEVLPSAYLAKPVNPYSLYIAIQNAINNFGNNRIAGGQDGDIELTSFFVKQGSKYKKINWKDVAYLSAGKNAGKNYTSVFNTVDKTEYFIRSSLSKVLEFLIPKQLQYQFVQINRSEIINLFFVQEVENEEVKMAFKSFSITSTYMRELRKRLNIIA